MFKFRAVELLAIFHQLSDGIMDNAGIVLLDANNEMIERFLLRGCQAADRTKIKQNRLAIGFVDKDVSGMRISVEYARKQHLLQE